MKPERFKHLFDRFQETTRAFSEEDWDNAVKAWDEYYQLIKKGLPLKRWIKNEQEGYLPDFLDTKEQRFGHARIGNYEQVMIYKYTGTDKKRENKYRSVYQSPDAYKCFDNESDTAGCPSSCNSNNCRDDGSRLLSSLGVLWCLRWRYVGSQTEAVPTHRVQR